jgi:hypothetical protein
MMSKWHALHSRGIGPIANHSGLNDVRDCSEFNSGDRFLTISDPNVNKGSPFS